MSGYKVSSSRIVDHEEACARHTASRRHKWRREAAPRTRPPSGRPGLEGEGLLAGQRVGECPHGQEVIRAGRASLSASSARMTSCPHRCPQTPLMHNICKRGQKKYTSKKVAKGRGHRRGHSPHRGKVALARHREPAGDSSQTLLPRPAKGALTR